MSVSLDWLSVLCVMNCKGLPEMVSCSGWDLNFMMSCSGMGSSLASKELCTFKNLDLVLILPNRSYSWDTGIRPTE